MKKKDFDLVLMKPSLAYHKFHLRSYLSKKNLIYRKLCKQLKLFYKAYLRFPKIKLSRPFNIKNTTLIDSLVINNIVKEFSKESISADKLSSLIHYSFGKVNASSSQRFYFSFSQNYPLELYIYSVNTYLKKGFYHYNVKGHYLEQLPFESKDFDKIIPDFYSLKNPACFFLISAVFNRVTKKYGERGYRYVLIESGQVAQNFILVSRALGLGCYPIVDFFDRKVNRKLDFIEEKESILCMLAIGRL